MRTPLVIWVALAATSAVAQQAVLLDRVAIVVDDQPVLRSTVLERARQLSASAKTAAEKLAALDAAQSELIEEILITRDAERSSITVTAEEIERGLTQVAESNKLTREQLEAAVAAQGLTFAQYQQMIGSQLLQMRWLMQKRSQTGTPADESARAKFMETERTRLVNELKKRAVVEVMP